MVSLLVSIENKIVGIQEGNKSANKFCVECGARMPRSQKVCPACGESQ